MGPARHASDLDAPPANAPRTRSSTSSPITMQHHAAPAPWSTTQDARLPYVSSQRDGCSFPLGGLTEGSTAYAIAPKTVNKTNRSYASVTVHRVGAARSRQKRT